MSAQINSLGVLAVAVTGISQRIQSIITIIAMAPSFMRGCCVTVLGFSLMAGGMGLVLGIGNTMLNLVISIADGVFALIVLSLTLEPQSKVSARGDPSDAC